MKASGGNCVPWNCDTWAYNADPELQRLPPTGTSYAKVRYILITSDGFADIDRTRLGW